MVYERFADLSREEPMLYLAAWDRDLAPGVTYGPVIRDIYIVECCSSGYGSVVVNGTEFPVGPGDCYVLFPGDTVLHTADRVHPRSGAWCAVDGRIFGQVLSRLRISSQSPFAPREAFDEIYGYLQEMITARQARDPGADLRCSGLVYGMLGALLRHAPSLTDPHCWVQKAVGIMETRYSEPLSVRAIADGVGLDRSYFSTLFKDVTGETPHAYLTSLRIRKACSLLKETDRTVAQVASCVGVDPQNFSRLFREQTGMTPRSFRKMQ